MTRSKGNTADNIAASQYRDQKWEEGVIRLKGLRGKGFVGVEAPRLLFRPADRKGFHCADSRLWLQRGHHGLGSGEGLEDGKWLEVVERFDLSHVSWHTECQYWGELGGDEAYRQFAERRAADAGLKVVEAPLMGSEGFQDAHLLIIDGTGRLNLAGYYQEVGRQVASSHVPQSFILTQAALGELVWGQAKAVIDIAMSDKGHGHRFNKKDPFVVVGIADNDPDHPTSSLSHIETGLGGLIGTGAPIVCHPFVAPMGI